MTSFQTSLACQAERASSRQANLGRLSRRSGDAAKAEHALSGVDGVTAVEATDASEPGDGVATLLVNTASDVREALCAALVGAGLGVLELRAERVLEGVFIKLASAGAPAQPPGRTGNRKTAAEAAEAS